MQRTTRQSDNSMQLMMGVGSLDHYLSNSLKLVSQVALACT